MNSHPFLRSVVLPSLLVLLAAGCQVVASDGGVDGDAVLAAASEDHSAHGSASALVPASEAMEVDGPADALGDGSLHDLEMIWTDQDDRPRTLAELGSRPLVMAMVYTTCTHTCPLIIADLKQIESALTPAQRAGINFVLVTLDPETDTPAQLQSFARDSKLDTAHWTLLTGTSSDVRILAATLGIRYRPGEAGEIAHSNALTIIDTRGSIAYQQRGVGSGYDKALGALVRLIP